MARRSRFRDWLFPPDPNLKYVSLEGKPKTIIRTGDTKGSKFSLGGADSRTEKTLKTYWSYYVGEGTIFASVNTTAWNTVMVGYNLVATDEEARIEVQRFFDDVDIDSVLLDNTTYALVFGDSFIEIVKDGNLIADIKTVNPITMNVNDDKFGRDESYQQKIEGELQPPLDLEDIIHFRFFPKPDSVYGVSLIEPSKDTIDRKVATDEALANAIIRHGTSKYVVTVGTPDEVPPDAVFTSIKNELEDINEQNEFIVPGPVKIETIDERGIQGIEEYFNYFQTMLIIGLLCPEEALGLGRGSTEATSKVKEIMYERMIKAIQHKLSEQIRRELINPFLEERGFEPNTVRMRFNSVTDADEAVKAKWLGNLLRGFPEGEKPFTIDEIRAIFDYPPSVKEGEGQPKPKPDEDEPKKPKPEPESEPKPKDEEREHSRLKKELRDLRNVIDDLQEQLVELRDKNEREN